MQKVALLNSQRASRSLEKMFGKSGSKWVLFSKWRLTKEEQVDVMASSLIY